MKQPAIVLLLLAVVLALVVALADRKPQAESAPAATAVSAQDAQITQLVQASCSGCHSLAMLAQHPQSRAKWQQTVERMIQLGAPVSPNDEPALVDYLALHFGKQ